MLLFKSRTTVGALGLEGRFKVNRGYERTNLKIRRLWEMPEVAF